MKAKRSNYYIPFKKDTEASGALGNMLKGGFIQKNSSGIYTWLNLGLKSLEKLTKIIDEVHEKNNAIKILGPMLQDGSLWKQTGRIDTFGSEMLKVYDRNNHEFIFGPTAEELFCSILKSCPYNKHSFPLILYQTQWKFRDEIRPKHGIIRGREFLMKDAYSFDKDEDSLLSTYQKMFNVYKEIFETIGLKPITLNADVGEIGGFLSHEFLIPSKEFGETNINFKNNNQSLSWENKDNAYLDNTQEHKLKYAEIGHIFALGDKYSKEFKLKHPETNQPLMMGCYGIGISRIIGLMFEQENLGILAPFHTTLISLSSNLKCNEIANQIYNKYDDIIWDNRENISAGVKFAEADLIGSPIQIIIGEKEIENNQITIKKDGIKSQVDLSYYL